MVGTISVYLVGGDAPFFPASGLCVRLVIRESVVEKKRGRTIAGIHDACGCGCDPKGARHCNVGLGSSCTAPGEI